MAFKRVIIGVFWDAYKLKNLNTINEKLYNGYEVERVDMLPSSDVRSDSPALIYVLKKEETND